MLDKFRVLENLILLIFLNLPILIFCQNSGLVIDPNQAIKHEKQLDLKLDSNLFYIGDSELFVYFQGGKDGPSSDKLLFKFIRENLSYPDSALKAGIEGKVYVSFTIGTIGKISNIEIVKGANSYFNSEVIRLISSMPDWIWDEKIKMKDRKLTKRTLPIIFSLK
jgi:TonB family protein